MDFIKPILVNVIVPPLGLLSLIALGLLIAFWRPRTGRAISWLGVFAMFALSVPAVSYALLTSLTRDLPVIPSPNDMPQAIVVLAGDVMHTAGPRDSHVGYLTLDRERAGADLQRRTGLPVLVTGGAVEPGGETFGAIMAVSLREDFRIPVKWIESESRDTWENAAFSATILRQNNIHSVYVVSQAWHLRRALLAFRKAGLTATAAPASTDTNDEIRASDLTPRIGAWQNSYYALHEWIGCVWYAIR